MLYFSLVLLRLSSLISDDVNPWKIPRRIRLRCKLRQPLRGLALPTAKAGGFSVRPPLPLLVLHDVPERFGSGVPRPTTIYLC